MIYDIIQLPNRQMDGELSTVVPLFSYDGGSDDLTWYGKQVDLTQICRKLLKYKTVEQIGTAAIERVFYTTEEIDLQKKWWTTKIDIYPVFYKVYTYPYQSFSDVYRYLIGSSEVLDLCDCGAHEQTIYQKLLHTWNNQWQAKLLDPKIVQIMPKLVHGNDENNIEIVRMCTSEYPEVYRKSLKDIRYNTDHAGSIFLNELTTKDMGLLKNNSFGYSLCKSMIVDAPIPFELDENTIYSEEYETCRWTLHRLIWAIEHSSMTDMDITLEFNSQHDCRAKCEFFSKYIGYTCRALPNHDTMKNAILDELRKWACMTSRACPARVHLVKTWLEEVFIEIQVGNLINRYYFDLAAYSLASLSFVDQFE